jgi:hypothetical protein
MIYENSIFPAYAPEKNKIITPCEHTLFLKVIIIAFTHKYNKNRKNTFFFIFQIFVCVRVGIIINFINPRQMSVKTRRQTAGLSPLIKVSKKNEIKKFQNGRCSIIHQAIQTQIQTLKLLYIYSINI